MLIKTDILVIGAGPAGCTAALSANYFKQKVVVIDRALFPRDKICGDGLLLNEMNSIYKKIGFDFEDIINLKSTHHQQTFVIKGSDRQFNYNTNFTIIKRVDFDNLLWKQLSDKNIPKFEGVGIKKIIETKTGYELIGELKENKSKITVEAKYIIAADGYSSYIRRSFFKNLKFNHRIASRYYYNPKTKINFPTSIIFDDEIIPGYFWAFQMDNNTYNTGVYLAENNDQNIYEMHNYFMQKYFSHTLPKKEFSTWSIPYNTDFSKLVRQNIVLTGDAAGLCDKMFGHGIDNAIISGYLAIESICKSEEKESTYPLSEIYRYKLSQYLLETLSNAEKTYETVKNNKLDFLGTLETIIKQTI